MYNANSWAMRLTTAASHPHIALPAALNLHQCSPEEFSRLRLAQKPGLLYWLARHWLANVRYRHTPKSKGLARGLASLRRSLRAGLPAQAMFLGLADTLGLTRQDLERDLRSAAQALVEEARPYPDEQGQVCSEILSAFNYDPYDNYGEIDMHSVLECSKCGHEELVREQCLEDCLESSDNFEHILGTAARCSQCDSVVRVKHRPATERDEVPYDNYGEDPFEEICYYIFDGLQEAVAARFPTNPDGLFAVGRNLDWRGRSGQGTFEYSADGLAKALGAERTEFHCRAQLILQGTRFPTVCASTSHHDVPMGDSRTLEPYWMCEMDGETPVLGAEYAKGVALADLARTILAGATGSPWSKTATFTVVSAQGLLEAIGDLEHELDLPEDTDFPDEPVEFIAQLWRSMRAELESLLKAEGALNSARAKFCANTLRACITALDSLEE